MHKPNYEGLLISKRRERVRMLDEKKALDLKLRAKKRRIKELMKALRQLCYEANELQRGYVNYERMLDELTAEINQINRLYEKGLDDHGI